jgi:insertion element IS1 protein InsB
MKCNFCNSRCTKKGFQANGKQKYRCPTCLKYQQEYYTYKAYRPTLDHEIGKLVKRGCGIRDIAFIKEISTTTVMKRIIRIANSILSPRIFQPSGDYEMDEMHTNVWTGNRKTTTYLAYAIHRQSGTVVGFTLGGRDSATLGKTINTILANHPKSIRTDRWSAYPPLIPKGLHICTRRKINHIERFNLTLRTRLKRLAHNRLGQSKNVTMLSSYLKICFWG